MSLLHTLFYFLLALTLLIAAHEFGHFWVARKLGVKVIRFSLGLGKPILRYQKRPDATEFTVAALPVGGYVRMVDEREGPVAPEDLPYAFNRQRLPVRFAIVAAGPLFNFLLAILLYWVVFLIGESGIRPVIGTVEPDTLAAASGFTAGDEIVSVAGRETPTWGVAIGRIFERIMEENSVEIAVVTSDGRREQRSLTVPSELLDRPEVLSEKLGLKPWEPELEPVIDRVEPDSPAQRAGLIPGDLLLSADGEPIRNWRQWVEIVRAHPGQSLRLVVERDGMRVPLVIRPEAASGPKGPFGRIGAAVRIPDSIQQAMKAEYRLGLFPALGAALERTGQYSWLSVRMIGRMLVGKATIDNLSGPIGIAQYAGQSASLGLMHFVKFLAVVSISLGVLNLLPVPILDGGHLLFYLIEAVQGRPLSQRAQMICQQVGLFILLSLMSIAFLLDIGRLLS